MRIIKTALLVAVFVGGLLACSDGTAAPPSSESVPNSRILDEVRQFQKHYKTYYEVHAAMPVYGWQVVWLYRDGTSMESYTFSTFDAANRHLLRIFVGGYEREGVIDGDIRKVELEPRFEFVVRVENCAAADHVGRLLERAGYYTDVRILSEWLGTYR